MGDIILGDNLDALRTLPDAAFQLIYIDPPFNTGKVQSRNPHPHFPRPHRFPGLAIQICAVVACGEVPGSLV